MQIDKSFSGIFKVEFENFINFKKSLGQYKRVEEKKIYEFIELNKFLNKYELDAICITKEMVSDYINSHNHLSVSTKHIKECNLRQFSKFLINQGYKNIYIKYDSQVKMPRDFVPYVFSSNEIAQIFYTLDNVDAKGSVKEFYKTFFRLLYCTGLRIGEALRLKIEDVDLINNVITIYSGKGNVSRMVPFKESLGIHLKKYKERYTSSFKIYFFESPKGGIRCSSAIGTYFNKYVLDELGLQKHNQNGHKRGVCIHTFRHTFACNALDQMIKEGKNLYCALPYLSFYMGHTSIVNTELYLRMTLDTYDEIIDKNHYIYKESIGDDYD